MEKKLKYARGTGFLVQPDADAGIPDLRVLTATRNIEKIDTRIPFRRPELVYVCRPIEIRVAALDLFRTAHPPVFGVPPPWPQGDVVDTTFQSLLPAPEDIAKDFFRSGGRPGGPWSNPRTDPYRGDGRGGRIAITALWLPNLPPNAGPRQAHVVESRGFTIPGAHRPGLLVVGMPGDIPGYCGLVSAPPNLGINLAAYGINKYMAMMVGLANDPNVQRMRGGPVVATPEHPGGDPSSLFLP